MKWLILILAICPCWATAADSSGTDAPAVQVKLHAVGTTSLQETITAYGVVRADPDAINAFNAEHPVIVSRLWITTGQKVAKGDRLVTLNTAPSARMAYRQAAAALDYARDDLERKRRLLKQQLATRADVASARKALQDARASLDVQQALGNDTGQQVLRAPYAGVVTSLAVTPGERLQGGAAILNLTRRDRLVVRLGVEPEEASSVPPGGDVRLTPLFGQGPAIAASVDRVQGIVDPKTRLVDVLVRLSDAQTDHLLPGMQLRGRITLSRRRTLAVPRSAVLTDAAGSYLFVVQDHHARRVDVDTGIRTERWVGVSGHGLSAGDRVVTEGNYELTDGARVRETGP